MTHNEMTHNEMVDYIVNYYNEHFNFQKFLHGLKIDKDLVDAMSDDELRDFIKNVCK